MSSGRRGRYSMFMALERGTNELDSLAKRALLSKGKGHGYGGRRFSLPWWEGARGRGPAPPPPPPPPPGGGGGGGGGPCTLTRTLSLEGEGSVLPGRGAVCRMAVR